MSRSEFVEFARRILLLASMAACSAIQAQPASVRVVDGQKQAVPWESMVDQVVSIDGIPWGGAAKGFGHYVSSPTQNAPLQVDHDPMQFEGQLVRVTGVLRRQRIEAAAPGAQGPAEPVEFYVIKSFSIEPIKKVERDQMLQVVEDWIYEGMDEEKALDLMASRKFPEYGLAMEFRPADVEPRPFLVEQNLALVLLLREKKVSSLMTVRLGKSKVEHKSDFVEAYRVAPLAEQDSVPAKESKE